MSRYGLYVRITAEAGQRSALVATLLEAARLLEGTPGSELYVISLSPADDDTIWVTEVWGSKEDHDASLTNDALRAVVERAYPLIAQQPEQLEIIPVGGRGLQ